MFPRPCRAALVFYHSCIFWALGETGHPAPHTKKCTDATEELFPELPAITSYLQDASTTFHNTAAKD